MEDQDEQEAFRTAVRDFVRMYAFLGQVVPFTSPELERLFYYCEILSPRLKKHGEPDASLDLGGAAVLTPIRTEAGAAQNVSLTPGEGERVPGFGGEGHGVEHLPDRVRLSALIEMLNTKFGFEFTEVDALMWDQQFEAAAQREELREVAASNTEESFGIVFNEHFADSVIERQAGNDDMFRMFFDEPEFREALTAWARKEVYRKIRDGLGGAA
jgi:type I restriction enzyme, R subunit